MKKILYLFIVLFVIIIGLLYVFRSSCDKYSCLSFANKEKFTETEQIENTTMSYRGILTKGDIRIRLEVYSAPSKEVAERFTQAKVMQLQGLFEIARSPYPGALSNEVVCEDKFKPSIKDIDLNGIKTTTITGFLNDRLQYGNCLESQITHIGKTAMFYCESQKKWYYFEVIAKKAKKSDRTLDTETTHLIQSLSCQKSF